MNTNFPSGSPSFGDSVRIRSSVETVSNGVAGLVGQVYVKPRHLLPASKSLANLNPITRSMCSSRIAMNHSGSLQRWLNSSITRPVPKSRSMALRKNGFARRPVIGRNNLPKTNRLNRGGVFGTDAEQIVGRERNQRISYRYLVRNVVDRRRVNSTVDMADSRQAAIVILRTRFRVGAACLGSWHWPRRDQY